MAKGTIDYSRALSIAVVASLAYSILASAIVLLIEFIKRPIDFIYRSSAAIEFSAALILGVISIIAVYLFVSKKYGPIEGLVTSVVFTGFSIVLATFFILLTLFVLLGIFNYH
ncbi:MAG: hypothetical protein ABH863_05955 [Candidatus Micrarchaeota archaeon]